MTISVKKTLLFSVAFLTTLSFILSVFPTSAFANQEESQEIQAEELAKEIEFSMNEATTKDENGKVTNVNIEKIKQRYGYVPQEYTQMQKDLKNGEYIENSFATRALKTSEQCFNEKMQGYLQDAIPLAAITSMYNNPSPKNIKKFSHKAVKAGLKGGAAGIAATITYNYSYCVTHYPAPGDIA